MYQDFLEVLSKLTETIIFEKNYETKISVVLDTMLKTIPVDAFSLYTYNYSEKNLAFSRVYNKTQNISFDSKNKPGWKPLPLFLEDGRGNTKLIATLCALTGKAILVDDVYENKKFDFSGTIAFDASTGYTTKNMLVLPLKYPDGNITGVLQLINRIKNGKIEGFSKEEKLLAMIFASHVAVALHLAKESLLARLYQLKADEKKLDKAGSAPTAPKAASTPKASGEKISAKEYISEEANNVIGELEEIAQLQWEWDEEVSKCISMPKLTHHEPFYPLIKRYSKILDSLWEFKEIAVSLKAIAESLQGLNLEDLSDKVYFLEIMETLGDALSQWKRTIFIDKNAEDIHYLDEEFKSFVEKIKRVGTQDSSTLELF